MEQGARHTESPNPLTRRYAPPSPMGEGFPPRSLGTCAFQPGCQVQYVSSGNRQTASIPCAHPSCIQNEEAVQMTQNRQRIVEMWRAFGSRDEALIASFFHEDAVWTA